MGQLVQTAGSLQLQLGLAAGEEPGERADAAVQPGETKVLSPPTQATHQLTHRDTGPLGTGTQPQQAWADLTNFC